MYTLFVFLITFAALGQEGVEEAVKPEPRVELGIKAGLNYNSLLYNNNAFDNESKIGYVGGFFISAGINKVIGGKAEALISQKSFSGSSTVDSTDYIYTRNACYIDFPLLLQIKPTKWLGLVGGVQYTALVFKGDAVETNNAETSQRLLTENKNVASSNLGACAGVEITFKRIWVWGRYNVDFDHNNGNGTRTIPAYRNQVVQIGVGYSFFRF